MWTPLHYDARYVHKQTVEVMISARCEIDPKEDKVLLVYILRRFFIMFAKKDIYPLFSFLLIKMLI